MAKKKTKKLDSFAKIQKENNDITLDEISRNCELNLNLVWRASVGENVGIHNAQAIAHKGFKKKYSTDTVFDYA